MIPTMLLFGLVFGRWWRATLLAAAIIWPIILLANGVADGTPWVWLVLGGAVMGTLNAVFGVAVHQAILWLVRRARGAWTDRYRANSPRDGDS